MEEVTAKWLNEVVTDAMNKMHKLDHWQQNFIANMQRGINTHGAFFDPSEKQIKELKKIERIIYHAG